MTSLTIRSPRLPGRGLAPTRATLRASSIAATAGRAAAPVPGKPGTGAAAATSLMVFVAGISGSRAAGQLRTCPARLALFWSAIAARAACQPGIPHTPPPAWVAELP